MSATEASAGRTGVVINTTVAEFDTVEAATGPGDPPGVQAVGGDRRDEQPPNR
jgi:hypothetical protein